MKKIIALALALVFAFALAVPAFAEDPQVSDTQDYDTELEGGSQDIDVVYNVGGSYIVTVPAGFTVTADEVTEEVSATEVLIMAGQVLTVALDSTNGFKLNYVENASADYIDYTVSVDGSEIDDEDVVLTVNEGGVADAEDGASSGSVELVFDFSDKENARYQGQYKDTITFTVAVTTLDAGN